MNPETLSLADFINWYAAQDIVERATSLGGKLRPLTDTEKRSKAVDFYNQIHDIDPQ